MRTCGRHLISSCTRFTARPRRCSTDAAAIYEPGSQIRLQVYGWFDPLFSAAFQADAWFKLHTAISRTADVAWDLHSTEYLMSHQFLSRA